MEFDDKKLKLIFVLKIGYNARGEGNYEFIFSLNPNNILVEDWCWDMSPACDHAQPPTEEYSDAVFNLKTKSFDLFCLHEAVDREYMHGYHTIHCLAYETPKEDENGNTGAVGYEQMFEKDMDDVPLLVFHYGDSLAKVKDKFNSRKIVLNKDNQFVEISSLKF
jgi:hypothetical protein